MSQFLVGVLCCTLQNKSYSQCGIFNEAIKCCRALLKFNLYAQYESHHEETLGLMDEALKCFHTFKCVFHQFRVTKKVTNQGKEGRKTLMASGKKICVQTHRLRPDAPGPRDALDTPCHCTYHSQLKTYRQCQFRHSLLWHRVSGCRSTQHLLTGRSVAEHFPSRRNASGHFPSGYSCIRVFSFCTQPCQGISLLHAAMSGHFPSGCSRVRAFSFRTQPCQGIFLLDAPVSGHFPSGRSRVRAFSYWTRLDDACHGSMVTLTVKARNVAANTLVAFVNT